MDRRIDSFRELIVWQKSMTLAEHCFALAARLPRPEGSCLAWQIRRCVLSIPSNIAEGHELSLAAYRHHVRISLGSLAELETQLELACRTGLIDTESAEGTREQLEPLQRMLRKLLGALTRRARMKNKTNEPTRE